MKNAMRANPASNAQPAFGGEMEPRKAVLLASELAAERNLRNRRLATVAVAAVALIFITVFGIVIFVHYAATHQTFLDPH